MYCWGECHGEEAEAPRTEQGLPGLSQWSGGAQVAGVSLGSWHTLLVTEDGRLFSCGDNQQGQLGHDRPGTRPQLVSALSAYLVRLAACGAAHSLAVSEWGEVFTWGCDSTGQLGLGAGLPPLQRTPKTVRALATRHVVQVAAGRSHSLALTADGGLYAWGDNSHGQLGLGRVGAPELLPCLVESLEGVPLAKIACGGNYTFVVSKSGAVYGWGCNSQGQLGLNDTESRCFPTHLKSMRSIKVCRISCGEEFTAFLTLDGGVFTCGAGQNGQLGHGGTRHETLPRKVSELMGTAVVQAVCGARCLLVVTRDGRVHNCGKGTGPLGTDCCVPQRVPDFWKFVGGEERVWRVFAGGERVLTIVRGSPMADLPLDQRRPEPGQQILAIELPKIVFCQTFEDGDQVDQDTLCYLETVFKSAACLNASFLTKGDSHYCCGSRCCGVDLTAAQAGLEALGRVNNSTIKDVVAGGVSAVLGSLRASPPDAEALRLLLWLPMYSELQRESSACRLQLLLAAVLARLTVVPLRLLGSWYAALPSHYFCSLVDIFKGMVVRHFENSSLQHTQRLELPGDMVLVLDTLERLSKMNLSRTVDARLPPEAFHVPRLAELVDIPQDYMNWLRDRQMSKFYLCNYPFLFDAVCKTSLLETDQWMQMNAAVNEATSRTLTELLLRGRAAVQQQFVVLAVGRHHIVADTLRELSQYGISDLKKPLKVKFHDEEAEDAGGVRKEFFMLLMREILDPKYGMFHHYPDTHCIWFAEESFEEEDMYLLIGVICGLAIYNFTIINLPFPLALYKKLLRVPVGLPDLADLNPGLAQGLQNLLDYEGSDAEEVFSLNFEISREMCGEVRIHQLLEGGSEMAVTSANKAQYVDLYVDFIFNASIEKKFNAFREGFYKVCGGRVLELFEPHELMALVVGNEEYDWEALESVAEYRGGYLPNSPEIRNFWAVLHELSTDDQRRFLLFLTGSDRIPIRGMKAIHIIIQPTNDDRFLPVAHTCFNLLDLPRYATKERLRYKLLQAIQYTEGFSLV